MATLDLVTLGETMLRLSPPGYERLSQCSTLEMRWAGAESNVAVALASLGYKTAWLSRLPDSALGHRIVADLNAFGVNTSGVRLVPGERLGAFYIENGTPPRPNRMIYDRAHSATSRMTLQDVDFDIVQSARWIHLTGITPALSESCRSITRAIIGFAHERNIPISFDVNYRARLWPPADAARTLKPLLLGCTAALIAHRDAVTLFGVSSDASEALLGLYRQWRCTVLVMTLGEEGAIALGPESSTPCSVSSFDVPHIVDRVGAGDAFDAGFIAAQLRGLSIFESLRYAHALSALKLTLAGDLALFNQEEIEDVLSWTLSIWKCPSSQCIGFLGRFLRSRPNQGLQIRN